MISADLKFYHLCTVLCHLCINDEQWVLKPEGRVTYYRDVDQKIWFSISPMLTLLWQAAPLHRLDVQLSVANQYVQQTGLTSLGLPTEFWFSASRELKPPPNASIKRYHQTQALMGATRPASGKCHVHTPNKGSQIALITCLSVSLCLNARRETRRPH